MKGKKEEMRIPMKFEEAVADFLKVKPPAKLSLAQSKVQRRREAGLCGACGHNPCECKRPVRKQKRAIRQTTDVPRKHR